MYILNLGFDDDATSILKHDKELTVKNISQDSNLSSLEGIIY